jgi:hypothetical protein
MGIKLPSNKNPGTELPSNKKLVRYWLHQQLQKLTNPVRKG